ncbi:MAG: HAD family hydrolase [Bryobacteraceae bacterium]|jgi:HAD superfamily hydrolase (TIGR01509 family)
MRIESRDFKALLFDLDGTLYKQSMIRRRMAGRLLKSCLAQPMQGWKVLRGLGAYRQAQEELRRSPGNGDGIADQQLQLASRRTGLPVEELRQMVALWMEERPLDLLAGAMWEGLEAVLAGAKQRGLRLGVVSDYPAEKKLEVMGLRGYFETVVTAQDAEVQRFKPDARSLEVALHRLNTRPEDALYIGDRPEVDAEAARRAGVACAILDPEGRQSNGDWLVFSSYPELGNVIRGERREH